MKMINAIITSCLFSGVAVAQDTDMDTMTLVQMDAATRTSLNEPMLSLNVVVSFRLVGVFQRWRTSRSERICG